MTRSYIPATPAGTLLLHIKAESEEAAWRNLMIDACFLPYRTKEGFQARGYEVLVLDLPDYDE